MNWYHIIEVKYLPATNHRNGRVQLYSPRFNERKVIPYDFNRANSRDVAISYLESKNFKIVGSGEGKDIYYIISDTFDHIK